MKIPFVKYHGTGNDFILIDHRYEQYVDPNDVSFIRAACDRRFGIGADGMILLEPSEKADFHMAYFNADGRPSSMCGNGGRCIVHWAYTLKVVGTHCSFTAIDGMHYARIEAGGNIALSMSDVSHVERDDQAYILDTGSPHYVLFSDEMLEGDITQPARKIRYNPTYNEVGINVNFAMFKDGRVRLRTYERGVEDETFSCGTGAVAVAVATALETLNRAMEQTYRLETKGGTLTVSFTREKDRFKGIQLIGPAKQTFIGVLDRP